MNLHALCDSYVMAHILQYFKFRNLDDSKLTESVELQDSGFSKQFVKLFRRLRKYEKLKYLPPRFSSFLTELAELYDVDLAKLDSDIYNSQTYTGFENTQMPKYSSNTYY